MGINSYITHRMFVAALSHEENADEIRVRSRPAETSANKPAQKAPVDARFSAVAQAETMARRWRATAVTTLL